ncbi:MAG TPA: ATP-binding cassette domain-containing protein, partial [Acidimicrobiales bacterium]|nr:ATP-binding cassette domain-containing protein [Acidimicrobiales bacterium]
MSVFPMPRMTRRTESARGRGPRGPRGGRGDRRPHGEGRRPHGDGRRRQLLGPAFERAGTLEAVAMSSIVRFRSAVSLLGRFPALAGVDLDVVDGEVVLVHGPNGAGKTTLLR